MKKAVFQAFFVLAMGGFAVSTGANLLSWAGVSLPSWLMFLHGGIFVVFLPAIYAAADLTQDYPQRDYWNAALRGCPPWTQRAVKWLMFYALTSFAASFVFPGADGTSVRFFSGHWMAFYGASAAMLHSAVHAQGADQRRRCPNGHLVSAIASYCERCGSPVGRQGPA